MKLPVDPRMRHDALVELGRQCSISRSQRKSYHKSLRDYYLRGSATQDRAKYNKLGPHVRQSTAYLYQSESAYFGARFTSRRYGDQFAEELRTAAIDFQSLWHDSGASATFESAVEWAHVYPSMFLKVIPSGGKPTVTLIPDPADLCVWQEDRPFDRQEAFAHFYYLDLPSFRRLAKGHPREADLIMTAQMESEVGGGNDPLIGTVERIIFDQSPSPMDGGGVLVSPTMSPTDPQVDAPRVLMAELWVIDERISDWRVVTCLAPAGQIKDVVWDRRTPVLSGLDPFVQLSLRTSPDYTYGFSEVDDLSGLQDEREEYKAKINRLFDLQLDPPLAFTGFGGNMEERARRFRYPGGTISTQTPGAKVERVAPTMPPEAFAFIQGLDQEFADQGGLPLLFSAQSDPSIRAGNQVGVLATIASARLRNNAMRVERACSEAATLQWRLHREMADEPLTKPDGSRFFLSELPRDVVMLVAAHSASPLYAAALSAEADKLLKAGAIDKPDYVRLKNPPMVDILEARARTLAAQQAEVANQMMKIQMVRAIHGRTR